MAKGSNHNPVELARIELNTAIREIAQKHGLEAGVCSYFAGDEALLASITLLCKSPEEFYGEWLQKNPLDALSPSIVVGQTITDKSSDTDYVFIGLDPDAQGHECLLIAKNNEKGEVEYSRASVDWINARVAK